MTTIIIMMKCDGLLTREWDTEIWKMATTIACKIIYCIYFLACGHLNMIVGSAKIYVIYIDVKEKQASRKDKHKVAFGT